MDTLRCANTFLFPVLNPEILCWSVEFSGYIHLWFLFVDSVAHRS